MRVFPRLWLIEGTPLFLFLSTNSTQCGDFVFVLFIF